MSSSDPSKRLRPGPWPPIPESTAIPPSSWAKRTGFRPKFSGETNATNSGQMTPLPPPKPPKFSGETNATDSGQMTPLPPPKPPVKAPNSAIKVPDGVKGTSNSAIKVPDGVKGTNNRAIKVPDGVKVMNDSVKADNNVDLEAGRVSTSNGEVKVKKEVVRKRREVNGVAFTEGEGSRRAVRNDENAVGTGEVLPQSVVDDEGFVSGHSHMKYELRDTPGFVPIGLYGFQHFLSMLGSLILIPLVIVPAMGGTYEDTANVVSTVLFTSGVTTLLHTSFGSRLPLIQGPSFVYLAPVLAIINSPEFLGLNGNNFKHIMKELQGAIIIGSAFQAFLGYSGLMAILIRVINPVVVSPTIAAVGLSFYSYGFPRVGACVEIGVVQILLVIIFSLYLRKISILGHRAFLIYAVPLALGITWAAAFLLTQTGVYSFKGCDANIPASNIISDHCRRHVSRMKYCRVDTSHALRSSPWFRFPYPLQWGMPVFHWKMALVMCAVSIISSVDSVGSYHASSLLVASRPPTPGVVSRGIGLEGLSSILAGLWGTGTGSTTLTENVHTIAVTKMGSRRAVELGACVLIFLSLIGKVGGFIASIPEVMVAALLCFMWAMLTALGLSNLRYSEAGSSRNIIIVGLSLFFSLSIPAYFQQYGISPNTNLSVPNYFQPYIAASHGPIRTNFGGLNYFLNTILSLHMVIAFLVAVILDNTVPGSRQERGTYVWSEADAARREPAVSKDYGLPFRVGRIFRWVKWVGL